MANTSPAPSITQRVQRLLDERRRHMDQVAVIDKTLGQIHSLLGLSGKATAGGFGSAAKPAGTKAPVGRPPGKSGKRRRRRRGRFETSAEQSILSFVQKQGNPSTREIQAHWQGEGRGGKADNTLSKLVKSKKLNREPLPNQRGSRYVPGEM